MRGTRIAVLAAFLCGGLLAGWAALARAEDYVIGPEDVLAISVWMHSELERTVTVDADGNITLPPVGQIKAAGLTTRALGDKVADRLSTYLRQTTTVTVTVQTYVSHSVFVTGGVAKPGRYGFERIPSLVDVLGQAGGAVPGADLAHVQVVRKEGDQRRTIDADLSAAMRNGDTTGLPGLKPGDTVIVPGPGGAAAAPGEGVAVLGEVVKPGVYPVEGEQDVWALLATAGGLTSRGSFKDVRLLTHAEGGQNVTLLDLRDVLDKGSRAPVRAKAGDVLVVMPHGGGTWGALAAVLSVSRDVLNMAVLVDYLNTNRTK